jgi:uncharacterized protein YceH (UPF0502 family)
MWAFLTVIVSLSIITGFISQMAKLKIKHAAANDTSADLRAQVARLEQRVANLESIIIEKERHEQFERL